MKGAREYARMFKTGQYGRLYIVSGEHARGKTFYIQVLPEGEAAIPNGPQNLCLNENAVLVYGEIGGHTGWTEEYGWIYEGPWVLDFLDMVTVRRAQIDIELRRLEIQRKERERTKCMRETALLETYPERK